MRIINAGADTGFCIALAGHRMTVTHTGGFPVVPVEVDALLLGWGSATTPSSPPATVSSTGAGSAPEAGFQPPELNGRIGTVDMFTATPAARLAFTKADTDLAAELSGDMTAYQWGVNGSYPNNKPFTIKQGQHATMTFANKTRMWHPMHLHGHTFAVMNANGELGASKDTVIVIPNQSVRIAILADNPGYWPLHCHNTYHAEAGMTTTFDYLN